MRLAFAAVVAWGCLSSVAAAQRAPIVFVGQGAQPAPVAADDAGAVADHAPRLAGGTDASYGYGQTQAPTRGAVIDIRRAPGGATTTQVSAPQTWQTPPAPQPAATAQPIQADGPVSLLGEQGAEPWLERERVGPPYEAAGRWYVPTPEPGYAQTGEASWYGPDFHGRPTASGETYDQGAMTAAHPTLPLQSLVQVTNLDNGREVIVRINDRGPFVGERLIDLSRAAATVLGFEQAGRARVHVRYLGPAPRRVNASGADAPSSTLSPAPAPAPAVTAASDGPTPLWTTPPAVTEEPAPAWNAPTLQQTSYAPRAAASAGAFVVQVGAYSDPANAQRVRDIVASAGAVEVDVRRSASGAELFRVRVGPLATRGEADAVRAAVARLGYGEAVVAAR